MSSGAQSEAVLIHLSGHDEPGLTADVTAILAKHQAGILDIGQAVVHETLALGMLIEIPAGSEFTPLRAELQERAHELGLQVRFRKIPAGSVRHWMEGQRQDHFIVTVLGWSITAEQLARVTAILAHHEMNVDRIERLSDSLGGRLTGEACPANACVELCVSGDAAKEAAMRAEFLKAAQELSVDIAFQRESIYRRNRRLMVFDMDSTLIQGEVIDELAKLAGVADEVVKITESAMRGELDFAQSLHARVATLAGLSEDVTAKVRAAVVLSLGAEELIGAFHAAGHVVCVVSGGFNQILTPLAEQLGLDHWRANELEVADGKLTGRVLGDVVDRGVKEHMLRDWAGQHRIPLEHCIAVGDGANDLDMLGAAGIGVAFNAKPAVRAVADAALNMPYLDAVRHIAGV